MGGDGTLNVTIGIGTGTENFTISRAFFVVISFASSDSQKKVSSESDFRFVDVGEVETFDGEAFSFVFSASGFQKKDKSEMGFVRGDTGDETSFMGGAIQRDTTCCMGAS